jgi:hypothetical protein
MRSTSRQLLVALLAVFAVISLWTPLAHPAIAARWYVLRIRCCSAPSLFITSQVAPSSA